MMGWPRNGLHRYDAGPQITRRFPVIAHGNTTLNVVYTNEESTLNETLQMFEHLLEDPKQRRIVGLDLEYTPQTRGQTIAVMQLAIGQHVLVYHFCRKGMHQCPPSLYDFLTRKQITFSTVDITGDTRKLNAEGIRLEKWYHVDIQDVLKFPADIKGTRAGMGYLAGVVIDPSYKEMAKLTHEEHQHWHDIPLSQAQLEYAARDGYVSYELWNRICNIKYGLSCGIGTWNDTLCDRCQNGEDYKIFKQNEGKPRPATENPWEQQDESEDEQEGRPWWDVPKKKLPTCMSCRDKEYWSAPRHNRRQRQQPMQQE